ncbi:MAG: PAS domain S-box protein [Desulfuromonadales bacterium]|nr:PAS domain S-box protein [Desulfuromonadales bacterium]
MAASDLEQENARLERELRIQRQIAFASGLFQDDVSVRTLLESLAEGVVIIENSGTILLANTRIEQMFGYPKKDLIGKPLAVLVPERFHKDYEEHQAQFFAEPRIIPMVQTPDLVGRRRDGSEFPLEISLGFLETINGVLAMAFVSDITIRKQIETRLRQSEELFHIQVECVKDYAIFTFDSQGIVLNWNAGAERLKGYRAEEIIGKHFSCFYSKEDRNAGKPEEELKKAAAEGRFEEEGWRIRKDGSSFWADVIITALHDENGDLWGFSKVTRDITGRKKAEAEIQDAREYAENIVETVREPLVVLSSDLKILTGNHSFYHTFQVTPDETIGNFIYDLGNRQWDIPKLRVLFEEILPHDTVFNGYEVEHDFPDIGRKIMLLNARQIFRENIGSPIILLAMEDITERKQLEAEIQNAREYAENIVETVREPLVVLNSDLKILTANHSFYHTFQVAPEDTIGNFIYDLGNRQWDVPKLRVLFEEILPYDTVFNGYEVEHDFPDIGRKIMLLNARQIFREDIGSHIILLAMEDITERKSAEEQIKILNTSLVAHASELGAANRELETFSYTVAHDLRKPLTVINGYCQVIEELCGDMLDEVCKGYLRETYEGTLRMNRLIDALLQFSSLAHVEPRRETVDLSAMAHEVAEELKLAEPERRMTFLLPSKIVAEADPELLRVVLANLFGNAWKYTSNREEGVIEFSATQIRGTGTYFIKDNGMGFDPATTDRLFAPFHRLEAGQEVEGLGIGLATVARIISRHGGKVWAEGEPGKGATFYFTLGSELSNRF